MAKVKSSSLTFAVTLPQPRGLTIPAVRAAIVEAVKEVWPTITEEEFSIKVHLTNKEVHYG